MYLVIPSNGLDVESGTLGQWFTHFFLLRISRTKTTAHLAHINVTKSQWSDVDYSQNDLNKSCCGVPKTFQVGKCRSTTRINSVASLRRPVVAFGRVWIFLCLGFLLSHSPCCFISLLCASVNGGLGVWSILLCNLSWPPLGFLLGLTILRYTQKPLTSYISSTFKTIDSH